MYSFDLRPFDVLCVLQVVVSEVVKGTSSSVSGSFALAFNGETTPVLPYTATASDVEAALEGLSTITNVQVTRQSFLNDGAMWLVRFLEPYGAVPLLSFDSDLTTLSATDLTAVVVEEVKGNELSGTFILDSTTNVAGPISFNASAVTLQRRLQELYGLSSGIVVTRGAQSPSGGVSWVITFPQSVGNVVQLQIDASGLRGHGAYASVETLQEGTVAEVQVLRSYATSPLSGTFSLAYHGEQSAPLPFDASADMVEAALESFHYIDDVIVTRSGPDAVDQARANDPAYASLGKYLQHSTNSYAWTVTFVSHVGDMPAIGLCCDAKFAFNGRQTLFASATGDATLEVEERRQGSGERLGGSFTLTVDKNTSVVTTEPIPYNASSEQMAAALLALTDTGNVTVTRSLEDENDQLTWSITFQDWQAVPFVSVRGVTVDHEELQGTRAHMTLFDGGDWHRKQIMQLSAALSSGNVSGCVLKPPNGADVVLSPFPFNGSAADLQDVFDALGPSVVGSVKVSLEDDRSPTNGSVWTLVFSELAHNMGPIDCGIKAQVRIVQNGTYHSLDGTFRLSYLGNETSDIAYDAAAADVQTALAALPGLSGVTVSSGGLSGVNPTRSWDVTFSGLGVDVPMLEANQTGLYGSSPIVRVAETRKGSVLSGSFRLRRGAHTTQPIAHDASADELQTRLLELPNVDALNVSKTLLTYGMAAWTVTFLPRVNNSQVAVNAGDLEPLDLDATGLGGFQAGGWVTTLQNGTNPIRGKFRVLYGSERTRKIKYNAQPADLHYFLRELPLPGGLTVSREGPDENGGYSWTVRLPLDKRLNQTLTVVSDMLLGQDPEVQVNVSYGTSPIAGRFRLGYRQDVGDAWMESASLPANASASQVASALSALPGLYNVSVSSERLGLVPGAHDNGARQWHVTFTSLAQAGDRPLMFVNDSELTGSNVLTSVVEATQGSSARVLSLTVTNASGYFHLSFDDASNASLANHTNPTRWLSANASALELSQELTALPGVGRLMVERQALDDGYVWFILFADHVGDNVSLSLNASLLHPSPLTAHPSAFVDVTANASVTPLSGYVSFVYGQRCEDWQGGINCQEGRTPPIAIADLSTASVKEALLSLPALVNVTVSVRAAPQVAGQSSPIAHGHQLRITFHEVAINVSGSAASGAYPWTWTPDIASVRWSGSMVVGGESNTCQALYLQS